MYTYDDNLALVPLPQPSEGSAETRASVFFFAGLRVCVPWYKGFRVCRVRFTV